MSNSNLEILYKKSFLKAIENSIGSRQYNSLYAKFKDNGEVKDILGDGEYSCAIFVSSVLALFKMIDEPRATVGSLRKFCDTNEKWIKINPDDIEAGDVIFWEKKKHKDETGNAHVGFASSSTEAVSTSYKEKKIVRHLINDRVVEAVYRYSWPENIA
jgi:hypothetical protein